MNVPLNKDRTAEICSEYRKAVARGEAEGATVGRLAAIHDVQRPAIWKALRRGGVLPPYLKQRRGGSGRPTGGGAPGYTARRQECALHAAAQRRAEPSPEQYVDRDPCERCGTRHDIGCKHNRAPLVSALHA